MIKPYEKYTTADFIKDEDFIRWVKYPTEESNDYWQTVLQNYPDKALVIEKAKIAVQQLVIVSKQDFPLEDKAIIWQQISRRISKSSRPFFKISWKSRMAAAAVIVFAMGIGYYSLYKEKQATKSATSVLNPLEKPLNAIINAGTGQMKHTLPDGSKIILEPNSKLEYMPSFNSKLREVRLSGEAFFDVQRDIHRPFLVYANGLTTKVLGTSFSIKAYEKDKDVFVNVKTGKVSVYSQKTTQDDPEKSGLVLTPNQQVVFNREKEQLVRSLVAAPTPLLADRELKKFSFKNAPIHKIFTALEAAYGIKIIYDKEVMANCYLTTSLTHETLFEKLAIICTALDASYKVIDAQVVISSNGCN